MLPHTPSPRGINRKLKHSAPWEAILPQCPQQCHKKRSAHYAEQKMVLNQGFPQAQASVSEKLPTHRSRPAGSHTQGRNFQPPLGNTLLCLSTSSLWHWRVAASEDLHRALAGCDSGQRLVRTAVQGWWTIISHPKENSPISQRNRPWHLSGQHPTNSSKCRQGLGRFYLHKSSFDNLPNEETDAQSWAKQGLQLSSLGLMCFKMENLNTMLPSHASK